MDCYTNQRQPDFRQPQMMTSPANMDSNCGIPPTTITPMRPEYNRRQTCNSRQTCDTRPGCDVKPNCSTRPVCQGKPACNAKPACQVTPACDMKPTCSKKPVCDLQPICNVNPVYNTNPVMNDVLARNINSNQMNMSGSFVPNQTMPVSDGSIPSFQRPNCPGTVYGPLESYPLGMAYVPWQRWQQTYPLDRALQRGTIFPELDLPFFMGRCQ